MAFQIATDNQVVVNTELLTLTPELLVEEIEMVNHLWGWQDDNGYDMGISGDEFTNFLNSNFQIKSCGKKVTINYPDGEKEDVKFVKCDCGNYMLLIDSPFHDNWVCLECSATVYFQ